MNPSIQAGNYHITFDQYDWIVTERNAYHHQAIYDTYEQRHGHQRDPGDLHAMYADPKNYPRIIEQALFGLWAFRYPYIGLIDGDLLCEQCSIEHLAQLAADPENYDERNDRLVVTVLDDLPPAGEICSHCSQYIAEPFCEDCGENADDLLYADEGYYAICRDCLAERLWHTKTGQLPSYLKPGSMTGVNTFRINGATFHNDRRVPIAR